MLWEGFPPKEALVAQSAPPSHVSKRLKSCQSRSVAIGLCSGDLFLLFGFTELVEEGIPETIPAWC